MATITITDVDYQRFEEELARELLALRREKTVYTRRINDLEREVQRLANALSDLLEAKGEE